MTIKVGDNPQNLKGINKFLSGNEGLRGRLIAIHKNEKEAIILCLNNSFNGSVEWGKLYLIKETNPKNYPEMIKKVSSIPTTEDWLILEVTNDWN